MRPGKRFEAKFRQSLMRLPGRAYRIHDGGNRVLEVEPGDFWYFSPTGRAFLIECKAEAGPSIRHDRLTQLDALLGFEAVSDRAASLVAVNFYGRDIRRDNRCILVPAWAFAAHALTGGRASLSAKEAERIGIEAPRAKGNVWDLGVLDEEGPWT